MDHKKQVWRGMLAIAAVVLTAGLITKSCPATLLGTGMFIAWFLWVGIDWLRSKQRGKARRDKNAREFTHVDRDGVRVVKKREDND